MRILLVRPRINNLFTGINLLNVEPLELEYLAATVKEEGWHCIIHDEMVEKKSFKKIFSEVRPDVVGITGYCNSVDKVLRYAELVKKWSSDTKVVIGGIHAEVNYQDFYKPSVDVVVHSGGCETFRRLIKLMIIKEQLLNLKGICHRDPLDQWCFNPRAKFLVDQLPKPDREHFYKHRNKFKYLDYGSCALVKTAYGCPYTCSFCYCRLLNDGHYTARSLEDVLEEIQGIDCDTIWMIDDTFLVDRERVERFARGIKERGIEKRFIVYGRADFICDHEELMPIIKRMGVIDVIVGLEAVDDERLKEYQKAYSRNVNEECVRILHTHGINCTALFMVHYNDTREDFNRLIQWIKERSLWTSTLSIFTPLPGTILYNEYKDKLQVHKHRKLDFLHLLLEPTQMSRIAFYYEFYKITGMLLWKNRRRICHLWMN